MRKKSRGRPGVLSEDLIAAIEALSPRLSNRAIARRFGVDEGTVRNALASIPPQPTAPPSAPKSLSRGEVRLARAILLQSLRDATGEVQPGDKSLERRVASIDARRFFGAVERARDLEVLAGLAKLSPGMVLDAMQRRDRSEIRRAIETETRLSLNLGMDL